MLSIDGVHIEKDLGLHLLESSNEPILPNTVDQVVSIPGRHGAYSMKSYMAERTFFQEVLIPTQATLEDVQKIVRKITELVLDKYGNPKEVELRWDYEPEKWYKAKFSGYISINRIHHAGIFYLPFTAYDPYAYALATAYDREPSEYDSGVHYDSGLMYENYDSFNWKHKRHFFGNYNHSYYATKPRVTIHGSVINPRITNLITGERIQLPSLSEKDILIVDFNNFTVLKNSKNAFMQYRGDFFGIESGDIQLIFEGGIPNAIVIVEWFHKFM